MWKTKRRILKELEEKRPLPMGKKEFDAWSLRVIQAALIPGATFKSQQFALANELTHLPMGSSFESDGYFVHRLRRHAINQVAIEMANEIRNEEKARLEKEKTGEEGVVLPIKNETKTVEHHPV